LATVVADELGATFIRIAANFLPNRRRLEEAVQKSLEQAPLMALMPQQIMAADHVAGSVGSVLDDPLGRLLHQTTMDFGLSAIWLQAALERTIERHQAMPEHFVAWANRLGLFDDVTFLLEGVRAWYEGDLVKALHVLVPQIERRLRSVVAHQIREIRESAKKCFIAAGVSR
jgi:lysyl-tRNA synthetase class 1